MRTKRAFPILLMLTAFIISGCGENTTSSSYKERNSSVDETSSSSTSEERNTSSSSDGEKSASSSSNSSSEASSSSSSSSSSSLPPEPTYLKKEITVQIDPGIKEGEEKTPYDISLMYDDELFLKSAKTYDEDLSMLSFGASVATASKERGDAFFASAQFSNITTHDYDKKPTQDTMGYYFAHKAIDDYELVAVSFRGFGYGMEWANNFVIGKTGNHEGFNARGEEAYLALQNYIATYASGKTLKLWINGYSRAGALSNVLASLILKGDKISVTQENMFVYTFEAPASLCEENAIAYENVHNITNEADLITFIPPETYGLKRCGVNYPIYDTNVSTLAKAFDPDMVIPEFAVPEDISADITSDVLFRDYLLNSVFNKDESDAEDKTVFANTREEYVDNYQEGLGSGIAYIFALTEATRAAFLEDLKGLGFGAISLIYDDTGASMADFLKTYLERDSVPYDADKIQSDCAILCKGIMNLFLTVLASYLIGGAATDDLTRLLDMHYPETTYVLLRNAHSKAAN